MSILLIRRREIPGDPWSGDVALPGGRRRPEDLDLLSTVVREVAEEVGIDLSGVDPSAVIGPFSSGYDPDLKVYAFVFSLGSGEARTSAGEEVAEVFWAPIDELLASRGEAVLPSGRRVRAYAWQGRVIWGLTYRVLTGFFRSREMARLIQQLSGREGTLAPSRES